MADRAAAGKPIDLIDHFAYPLPLTVICELLGIPPEDRDDFRGWTAVIVAGAAGDVNPIPAMLEMSRYIRRLIVAKRAAPDEALLSGLIEATDAGERLTEDELTSMVFLLLLAGHETTVNLIGNGLFLLLQRPDEAAALRADPQLTPAAIEEFLRYESPVKTSTMRRAVQEVTYDGVTIPEGAVVLVALGSANRDGDAFPGADKLELRRADGPSLAFGHGIHYCLGAPLARLEGQIAIDALLARFPGLSAAEPLDSLPWITGVLIRGLTRLPARLT
jgi:cytochrome P450